MEKTYWNHKGRFEELNKKLHTRIDEVIADQGEDSVRKSGLKGHPKLEKLRRAKSVYYDIFNNGGWNESRSIKPIFGVRFGDYKTYSYHPNLGRRVGVAFDKISADIEPVMDRIILEAAAEQNLIEEAR